MNHADFQIRQLSPEHLSQYNDLLRYAFQVTEKTLLEYGWENDDIRQSKFPVLEHAYVLGCFDNDSLVSQFAVYPITMNIHAARYAIGFITSVATYPEYTGMGLMSKLMKQSLLHMKESGQSLALLYPYSIPLYRHRGWEIVSDKMTYRIADRQLPKHMEVPGYVRRVSEDSMDLVNLHAQFASRTHGCLFRNALAWEEYWRWDEDDTTVAIYYSVDDQPMGYMVYLIKEDVFYVKEMIYLNMEARNGLMKYMSAHDSMIDEVRGDNYLGESIAFTLEDSDIKETIRPYIMGRIVDFEAFIKDYAFERSADGVSITFIIDDPFLEWNSRSFTVAIRNGKGHIIPQPSAYKAALSIGTMTTLLLGYKTASKLAEIGHIEADDATLRAIDSAVIGRKPYLSDYI